MTALSDVKNVGRQDGKILEFPVSATEVIYKGAIVCTDTDGFLVPGVNTVGYKTVGVATESGDNSLGSDGETSVRVDISTVIDCAIVGATQALVGTTVYVTDDQTVQTAAGNGVVAGTVVEFISATKVRVKISL
jgi:hypothetical protein